MKPPGACVIILDEEYRILILKRSSDSYWMPDKWGLPGGKIEEGETAEQAAIRETFEETQLQVQNLDPVLVDQMSAVFWTQSFTGDIQIDFEHSDWTWVNETELTSYEGIPYLCTLYDRALNYAKKENQHPKDQDWLQIDP